MYISELLIKLLKEMTEPALIYIEPHLEMAGKIFQCF